MIKNIYTHKNIVLMSKSIKISGKILSRYNEIMSDEALEFIQEIHEQFNHKRLELLSERKKRQKLISCISYIAREHLQVFRSSKF